MPVITPEQESLVQSAQWRIDHSGQDTLQEAETAADWQPLYGWKNWGFGAEPVWLRLRLKAAQTSSHNPWLVRIRPAYLDHITLYDPMADLVIRSGDAVPPSQDDLASINFTLQIPALPKERTVYLQIRSTSTRTASVDVQPYGRVQQLNRLQEWTMGFVLASSAIFAVWAFVQWWTTREKLIGVFALKQFVATFWAFFVLGFARVAVGDWLPSGLLSAISSTAGVCTLCATFWFLKTLLQPYQPAPLSLKALNVIIFLALSSLLLQAWGQTRWMLWLANHLLLLGFIVLLVCIFTAVPHRTKQPLPLVVLLTYLLIYIPLNSLPALIGLGWVEARPIVLYGQLTHALFDGLVMFVLLQIRARALRQEQLQIAVDFQRSQQQAEDEKRHREEQSRLFAMLAHEMKTPLATLRMWMEAGQLKPEAMEKAIADMNSVIERCVHTGQLADEGLQPDHQMVEPLALTHSCIQSCRDPSLIDLQAPATSGVMHTDPQMLSIVLGNLLDNACKYGAPNSRIEVRLEAAIHNGHAGWLWQVRNQAGLAGLPDTQHLFEKYYRSPQARRLSGSGLGLFLVKGLLDLMEGNILYETRDGSAVFSIWLPQQPTLLA